MVEGWRVPTATAVLSVAVGAVAKGPSISSGRPATPTEISCAFLAFKAARLKMGLTFEIDSPPVSAVLTTGVSAPAVPTVKPRTVKMNAVIDQTDETEVPVKTPATMKALSEIYIKKEGGEPDAEVTQPPNRPMRRSVASARSASDTGQRYLWAVRCSGTPQAQI